MFYMKEVKYHNAAAKMYMPLLRDEMKPKHPALYAFADKRWRYHMKKSCEILKEHLSKMERS